MIFLHDSTVNISAKTHPKEKTSAGLPHVFTSAVPVDETLAASSGALYFRVFAANLLVWLIDENVLLEPKSAMYM